MLKAAHVVALVIAVVLVTRHAVDAQPRVRNRRAGRVSGNDHPLSKDQGPETLPPGQDEKTLPVGEVGASRRRTDQFDESFNLVEDEVRFVNVTQLNVSVANKQSAVVFTLAGRSSQEVTAVLVQEVQYSRVPCGAIDHLRPMIARDG
jgi:hypothetical protein